MRTKKKIIYHEPPMKYNVALAKFEPDLPLIKKDIAENKILTTQLIVTIIFIIAGLAIVVYLMSQLR